MDISKYVPILEWLPRYKKSDFRGDLQAGLTVGIMLIPQGMAYALLAGLPPIYGMYAGIVPLILYAFFGSSRHLSVGPVALVSLLILAGVSQLAETRTEAFAGIAIATALVAGIIQVLLALFRLGFLINFLSHPVISGFTSAAAFIIGLGQLQYLLGVNFGRTKHVQDIVLQAALHIQETNFVTLAIGAVGIVFIAWLRHVRPMIPGGLLVAIIGITAVWAGGLHERFDVAIVGNIPRGLPHFEVPVINLALLGNILPLALTICLISFIESLAISKTLAARDKTYRVDANQELLALGISKIGGAFFQSFPTTGSFTRSAINYNAGARTGMSSIIATGVVAIALLFFTPVFFYLPKAMLAAVIIMAVVGLVDYREAIHLWKTDKRDFLTLMTTFIITLTLGIQTGVATGVVLSIAILIYRNSRPHVAVLGQLPDTRYFRNISRFEHAIQYPDKLILRFDAQLYFGNAEFFRETIERLSVEKGEELRYVILDCASISDMDSTGIHTLRETVSFLQARHIQFAMGSIIGPVRDVLRSTGMLNLIGRENIFLNVYEAITYYKKKEEAEKEQSAPIT
ncbi:MAG: solute carrier family 26 protein [Saprospiraceae bacterium]|nr:solute carrier family 26 protein [Saprospiraceae bacterium]